METHTYTFVPLLLCSCNPMQWQMLQPARLVFTHEAFVVARSPVELQLHMIFRQPFNPFTPKKKQTPKLKFQNILSCCGVTTLPLSQLCHFIYFITIFSFLTPSPPLHIVLVFLRIYIMGSTGMLSHWPGVCSHRVQWFKVIWTQ